ncbi:hypothetical protein [Microvirga sp. BSC39]|uniref:hypothetical protein n=1 Tax=Microvirga sp. BSC39 TaxID=1549810 RepID=UPI0004E91C31|nr:hypothetical protein [Microvirga sp. BSC39]KFG69385.1 hypothetical protein JH26_11210 [Microvirga sp. BSC39]
MDRRRRFETTVIKNIKASIADIERSYQEEMAGALAALRNAELEIQKIDYLTPNGRYDRSREADLASKGLVTTSSEVPAKRGPGRPRKYQPGDPRPPRKSRAKVRPLSAHRVSSAESGSAKPRTSGSTRRPSSRMTSGTVSPVTAALARVPTPAPKAAPQVAAALLESTMSGGHGVDTIQIETPEKALEIRPVEQRRVQVTIVENDPEYEAELAEQAAHEKALWDALNEPGEEIPPEGLPRKKTKFSMNYDFSDAMDKEKTDPAVLALFPHFGFATTEPSESMSKEDLRRWLFATRYSDEPNDEARTRRFNDALRIRRDIPGVYNAVKHRLDPLIQRERDRIMVWHTVHLRVINAEQYSASAAKGEMDQDLAFMWMAHRDYIALGNLTDSEHLVWREIVDAMEWPKGFSRIDLALWAEQDPSVVPDVRSWAGEPKNFPERLRFRPFPP